jgi:hypothetical protein
MAFTLPVFNLSVDIWTGPWATKAFRLNVMANLAWGKRINFASQQISAEGYPSAIPMTLLLPSGTDIRSYLTAGVADFVEVPSGSGRWYGVNAVDDIGKGFPNEHRGAYVTAVSQFLNSMTYPALSWPVPMP